LLAAALAASSAPAWGQTTAARLEVEAQPSCSTRDELIARVAARSARIRFVDDGAGVPVMTARIDAGPKGAVVAELTVVEPDGRRFARRLEAPSCAAATDALALVVAITLDPSAATAEADKLNAYPVEPAELDQRLRTFESRFPSAAAFEGFLKAHDADRASLAEVLARAVRTNSDAITASIEARVMRA